MKVIKACFEILDELRGEEIVKKIELCGRVCYKSEERISAGSAEKFIRAIIKNGHESVLEHFGFSVRFTVDRGVSHEIVRHRIASFSQESTRYCNYKDGECAFISPAALNLDEEAYRLWEENCKKAEETYNALLQGGATPQSARSVLPNSLKTELIMTCNLREWRHFLKLRASKASHPQMREVAVPLLAHLKEKIPAVFEDIVAD